MFALLLSGSYPEYSMLKLVIVSQLEQCDGVLGLCPEWFKRQVREKLCSRNYPYFTQDLFSLLEMYRKITGNHVH